MVWVCGFILLTFFLFMPLYFGLVKPLPPAAQLMCKAAPTFMAALFSLCAFFAPAGAGSYAIIVTIAIFICTAADVLLNLHILLGGAAFFLGHILFVTAFLLKKTPGFFHLAVFLAVCPLLFLVLRHYRPLIRNPAIKTGVVFYCGMLALLLSAALPLPFCCFQKGSLLAALGALLFVLSDVGVAHHFLKNPGITFQFLSLGCYYLAQLLLALSAFG